MAHNELALDSNAIDIAFSKTGTRIAVLMNDRFSIFLWSLKSRPVPVPILESSYPLSDEKHSRPRQIAFINDNEVFVLRNTGPNNTCIERTTLETRETKVAYEAGDSEQLISIFTSLGHEALWFSNVPRPGQTVAYSSITIPSLDEFRVNPWAQSPAVDTYWAKSVQISDDDVRTKTGAMDSSLIFIRRS
jgi:elongator complex protein 1